MKADNHVSKKERNSYEVIIMNSFMNSTERFSTCMGNNHATRLNQPDTSFMLQKRVCLDSFTKMALLLLFCSLLRVAVQCIKGILHLGTDWTNDCR